MTLFDRAGKYTSPMGSSWVSIWHNSVRGFPSHVPTDARLIRTERLEKAVPTAPFSCGSTGRLAAEKLEGSAAAGCSRDSVGWWAKDLKII